MTYSFYSGTTAVPSFTWQATYNNLWTTVDISSTALSTEASTIAITPAWTLSDVGGTGVDMVWGSVTNVATRTAPGAGINAYESGSFRVWGDYASILVDGSSVMTIGVIDFNTQSFSSFTSTASVPEPNVAMLLSLLAFFVIFRRKRV